MGWFFLIVGVIAFSIGLVIAALRKYEKQMEMDINSAWPRVLVVGGLVFGVIGVLLASFVVVQPGFALQVVRFGQLHGIQQNEGFHVIAPFIDDAYIIDCRVRKHNFDVEAGTIEIQPIRVKGVAAWRINRAKLPELIRQVGLSFEDKAVIPVITDGIKAACGQHKADSFNRDRRLIMDDSLRVIQGEWEKKYSGMFIIQQVSMTDFNFTDKNYNAAIIEKQTAEQHAEKEKYNLIAAGLKAQQEVKTAEGKAKAQILLREALAKDQTVLDLKRLEVMALAVGKWDGKTPSTIFNADAGRGNFLFGLDALQSQVKR